MLSEDRDIDPEDPDSIFLPSDRRKFDSRNPRDVLEHDRALAAFEKRHQAHIEANVNTSKNTWYGLEEVHVDICTCSYCGRNGYDRGMKLGLNIPPDWLAFNAWWVIRRDGALNTSIYKRFTPFSFLRKPQLAWREFQRKLNDCFKWTN